jgi:hypothetical protein
VVPEAVGAAVPLLEPHTQRACLISEETVLSG